MPTTIECPLCFRKVGTLNNKMITHLHTPFMFLTDAKCEGTGRTPAEAKKFAADQLKAYRIKHAKKS